jgi:hypothetical protein
MMEGFLKPGWLTLVHEGVRYELMPIAFAEVQAGMLVAHIFQERGARRMWVGTVLPMEDEADRDWVGDYRTQYFFTGPRARRTWVSEGQDAQSGGIRIVAPWHDDKRRGHTIYKLQEMPTGIRNQGSYHA